MAPTEATDFKSYLKLTKLSTAVSSELVRFNRLKCIERILEQGGDINYKLPSIVLLKTLGSHLVGSTILHLHDDEISHSVPILSLLVKHGLDFLIRNPKGRTVIHNYLHSMTWRLPNSSSLELPVVDFILSMQIEFHITENFVDPNGLSHFHAACVTNNLEAIEFFLNNGASIDDSVNVDSPIFAGYTPLHFATRFLHLEAVKLLLQCGASVDTQDTRGMTSLHLIFYHLSKQERRYKWTLDRYINVIEEIAEIEKGVNAQDHFGLSYLHVLCTLKNSSKLAQHLNEIEDVNRAVNVDSPMYQGFTPLHFAAMFNADSLKLLLAKGADVTIKNVEGNTPLDLCVARYDIEDVHDILGRSTFRDVALSDGKTKLVDLVFSMRDSHHFKKFFEELGDQNVNIPADSNLWPGYEPLHLALIFQKRSDTKQKKMLDQVIEICLKNGVNVAAKGIIDQTPLQFAFRHDQKQAVDSMLKLHKGTSNPVDKDGLSLLHIACATQSQGLVKKLLVNGANVNCKLNSTLIWYKSKEHSHSSYDSQAVLWAGSTPLHIAVSTRGLKMLKLLLKRGANPQARDADGLSPVHRLMFLHDAFELCNELLSSSKLRDCVADGCGLSHLHVACDKNHLGAVKKLLLEPEAQVNGVFNCKVSDEHPLSKLACYDGHTPLHVAMSNSHDDNNEEVVKLLLERGADVLTDSIGRRIPLYKVMNNYPSSNEAHYDRLFVGMIRNDETLRGRVERVSGFSDLHLACCVRDLRWIQELLADGVDVNARIRDDSPFWSGYTPLHVLMMKQPSTDEPNTIILQLLLDNGADVGVSAGRYSNTPLHMAERWSCVTGIFCMLGRQVEDRLGSHRVKKFTLPDAPCDSASLMIRSIKDFTLNPVNIAGVSHFHIACWCLDVVAVEKFLKRGVDVNAKLDYFYNYLGGYTPLHLTLTREASSPRKMKIVELLLKHGADVHAESYSGNTPLHYAAMHFVNVGLPIFTMIFESGADINAKNILGESPLEILLNPGKISIEKIKYFINGGCRINNFNGVSDEGFIPLTFAAYVRKLEKEKHSYTREKDKFKTFILNLPNIHEVEEAGRTAIHNIVSIYPPTMTVDDYADLIKGLEKLGCDIDHQDKSGQTALHAAARFQNDQAISVLLEAGADSNIIDAAGKTAFAYSLDSRRVYNRYRTEYEDIFNREAMKLLAAHVRKLQFVNLEVDTLMNNRLLRDVNYKHCVHLMDKPHFLAALGSIGNVKVGCQSLTLRDFMSENGPMWNHSKMRRMPRKDVLEFFNTIFNGKSGGKIYELRGLVKLQYRNYLARPRLVEAAKLALHAVANFPVPDVCSEIILAFCANWELKNFIETAK